MNFKKALAVTAAATMAMSMAVPAMAEEAAEGGNNIIM